MRLKVKFLIVLFSAIIFSQNAYSQFNNFECGFIAPPPGGNNQITNPFTGLLKPTRTNISSDPEAYFPVLVVFVQFKDEGDLPRDVWPKNGPPAFLGNLIATQRNIIPNTPFWEMYNPNTQMISSRWAEISRGAFHVTSPSGAFSVVLPKTAKQYLMDANWNEYVCGQQINRDIWDGVKALGLTNWKYYDRWKKNPITQEFEFCALNEGDGYVDMIYKVHKSPGPFEHNGIQYTAMENKAGYASLGYTVTNYDIVDPLNIISVYYGGGPEGSGVTLSFKGSVDNYIATTSHEHLHLMTYGGHVTYSSCSYGIGIEYFYSPYDMILNEYMTPTTASFGQTNYLSDYSSRNTGTGEILKVPISGNECFLLANRNKVSKWDRVMLGDTASLSQYEDNTEYGKGLYIYHVDPQGIRGTNYEWSNPQDMECADGYWEWEFQGKRGYPKLVFDCFAAPSPWRTYKKINVLYSNDPSEIFNLNPYGDEVSFRHHIDYGTSDSTWPCWWGIGKQPIGACFMGTDRIYTNDQDIYTKSGNVGDRWDAWKPGYNEVFSPYSSPSTKTWNNQGSGIFIWYHSTNGNTANIDIYKVGEGVYYTEDDILAVTPPSRPMGIKTSYEFVPNTTICHPKITWNHNQELDMINDDGNLKYKIYRALSDNMNEVPVNYYLKAIIEINKNSPAVYVDEQIVGILSELGDDGNYEPFPLRYKVVAVDVNEDESVLSDFTDATGLKPEGSSIDPGNNDNPILKPELPKKYNLSQNYPNPFNPMTKINFALPKQGFVTLKIYDITGREIKTLVNEFKQAGYYTVDFNGSSLASGVYFYRIQSGDFVMTKRMVLVK